MGQRGALPGEGCADDEEDGEVEESCEVDGGKVGAAEVAMHEAPVRYAQENAEDEPEVTAGA